MRIEINTNPYGDNKKLYPRKSFELQKGITILVGCNGAGKSTLLRNIDQFLRKKGEYCFYYDDKTTGKHMKQNALNSGKIEYLTALVSASEGEEIMLHLNSVSMDIGKFVSEHNKDNKPLFLLFDAIGSGSSINAIMDVKEYLFEFIIDDNKNRDIYIIVAANEYEFANGENCLDVQHLKYITFEDYEDYKKFIIKSKEIKDKRFEN